MTRRTQTSRLSTPERSARPLADVRLGAAALLRQGAALTMAIGMLAASISSVRAQGESTAASTTGGDIAFQTTQRDPWVPPAQRKAAATAAAAGAGGTRAASTGATSPPATTRGPALRAQAEARLRTRFDAAAGRNGGRLTASQARSAGLGFIVQHFDRIDTQGRGSVSFDDLLAYLRSREEAR